MTECDAFSSAILANPADDTARVVFADWLEEHGNDPVRAAVIRIGVVHPTLLVHATRRAMMDRSEVWELGRGLATLGLEVFVPGQAVRLREELPPPERVPGVLSFTFRRGFVESVRMPWGTWCRRNTAEVLRSVYPITRVDLTDGPEVGCWEHSPSESHAWVCGQWVTAPHSTASGTDKTLHFCGLRWPGVTFTSPRGQRRR